ncbi:MAG: haloacid dehalogenase-like hydrolase [Actinobacteria bacterium]|nr:haloacid dehalogenase-like hydrolase [Actinomycetota bacterium]
MRLILWDVDGTLVRTPGTREAFTEVLAEVTDARIDVHGHPMSGKTDPQIARELLSTVLDVEAADAHLDGLLERYATELAKLAELIRHEGRVLPGVPQVLERLSRETDVRQTVLTGNLEATTHIKLSALGLDGYLDLDVGAYGSDHHDRDELVPIALEKVRAQRSLVVDPQDVWVIGDSPLDLRCARAGGARCLLVATNQHPYEELVTVGADMVVEDLSDTDLIVDLLIA